MSRAKNGYRVVYGETAPSWEFVFPSMRMARAFAKKHEAMGDKVFSVKNVVPGEPPQSIMMAIELGNRSSVPVTPSGLRGVGAADERMRVRYSKERSR